jgi:hypothetical protein
MHTICLWLLPEPLHFTEIASMAIMYANRAVDCSTIVSNIMLNVDALTIILPKLRQQLLCHSYNWSVANPKAIDLFHLLLQGKNTELW